MENTRSTRNKIDLHVTTSTITTQNNNFTGTYKITTDPPQEYEVDHNIHTGLAVVDESP